MDYYLLLLTHMIVVRTSKAKNNNLDPADNVFYVDRKQHNYIPNNNNIYISARSLYMKSRNVTISRCHAGKGRGDNVSCIL